MSRLLGGHMQMPQQETASDLAAAFQAQDEKLKRKLEAEYQRRFEAIKQQEQMLKDAIDQQAHVEEQLAEMRRNATLQQQQVDELMDNVAHVFQRERPPKPENLVNAPPVDMAVANLEDENAPKKKPEIHPDRQMYNLKKLDLKQLKKLAIIKLGVRYRDIQDCSKGDLRYMLQSAAKPIDKPSCFEAWCCKPQFNGFINSRVVDPAFDWLACTVILVNAVFIGISAQHAIDNWEKEDNQTDTMKGFEIFFFIFYWVELLLRLKVWKLTFFTNKEDHAYLWNCFDLFLVLMSTWDIYSEARQELDDNVNDSGDDTNLTWLRLLRLLKMLKMLRVIRVMRFFRELRLMLFSIVASLRSLLWALIMLCLIIYAFSICFLQATTAYINDHRNETIPAGVRDATEKYWGSLDRSFLSLYQVITHGHDWAEMAEPIMYAGDIYYALFMIYVGFLVFAVLNVLTGMFVNQSAEIAAADRESVIQQEMAAERSYFQEMRELFAEIKKGKPGKEVSWAEFDEWKEDRRVKEYFWTFDIDDPKALWMMIQNEEEKVLPEEFIAACTKARGTAKSLDCVTLMHETQKYMAKLAIFMEYVEERFNEIRSCFEGLGEEELQVKPLMVRLKQARCLPWKLQMEEMGAEGEKMEEESEEEEEEGQRLLNQGASDEEGAAKPGVAERDAPAT